MLKVIALAVVVLIVGVLVYAATRPDTFRVERAATIQAPPEKVYALISDFGRWQSWSPWEKKDPAMRRTLGAVTAGTGATYAWEGNNDIGAGRMEITEAVAPAKVALKLDFLKPFEAHNVVTFTLVPSGSATRVTWAMEGPVPYVAKIMHLFFDMDAMVGKDFEAGLASMQTAANQ